MAGKTAHNLYRLFENEANNAPFLKSLHYFLAARFFRVKYISESKKEASLLLSEAFKSFKIKDIERADNFIKKTDALRDVVLLKPATIDSIETLRDMIKRHKKTVKFNKDMWASEDIAQDNYSIEFKFGLHRQAELENHKYNVVYLKTNSDKTLKIAKIPSSTGVVFKIAFNYKYSDAFYFGIDGGYTEINSKSDTGEDLKLVDYDNQMILIGLNLKYLQRVKVGVRPYFRVGSGVIMQKRKASHAFSFSKSHIKNGAVIEEKFYLGEDSNTIFNLDCSFGIEYIEAKNSSWLTGVEMGYRLLFNQPSYMDSGLLFGRISLGYIF